MSTHQSVAVRFMLETDAAPGLLSRLLQPFAKRDLIPDRMWSHRSGEMLLIQGVGRTNSVAQIRDLVVTAREGVPIPVGDLAEVAGVEAHSTDGNAFTAKLPRHLDSVMGALHGVPSVEQQDRISRERSSERAECVAFVVEGHHERVSHRAAQRGAELSTGLDE